MAFAETAKQCIDRHVCYPFDIAKRLKLLQRQRLTKMIAPVHTGEIVLDVGCNSGYLADFLPPSCTCWGVDVSPELICLAKKRLARAEVALAESLPFQDRSADIVVLGEILEHVYEPITVVAEAARVARRLVIGSTPHESGKWGTATVPEHRFHVRCFTEDTLRGVLSVLEDVCIHSFPDQPQFYLFLGAVS